MTQLEIMDTIRREIQEKGISQAEFSKMLGYGPQKFETDYYRVKHGHTICKSSLEMYLSFIGFKLSIEHKETPDIVRCKDCKHRDPEDGRCDSGHDIRWNLPRQDDWFCKDGERR